LDYWYTSDLTDYPKGNGTPVSEQRYPVKRYLLRDFTGFPNKRRKLRYWVEGTMDDVANKYFYVDEDSELLPDILEQEETYGCLPEKGISGHNQRAVRKHKVEVYGVDPAPIVQDTWNGPLPYTTRKEPSYRMPRNAEEAIRGVVHDTWRLTDGRDLWYQALVVGKVGEQLRIRWTDGREETKSWAWVRDHWYNPVALVYHFKE
jgi:hypothetical protein